MNTGKVILGALVGVAAGAVLGVLFAPKRGAVTRRAITIKSKRQVNEMKSKFNEFVDSVNDKFEKVKQEVVEMVEDKLGKKAEVEKDKKAATE
ncbi:MAG: YtxH domain-containing protein [Paludibacter sp.]